MQPIEYPRPKLIKRPEVEQLTAMSRASIYRAIGKPEAEGGGFPRPVKVGRASAWVEAEVLGWIKARMNERAV